MKKLLLIILSMCMLMVLCSCQGNEKDETIAIVANVNGIEITQEEYSKRQQILKNVYMSKLGKDIWTQPVGNKTVKSIASEELLEVMIQEVLIKQYMEQHGYIPMEDEVQKRYQDFEKVIDTDDSMKKLYEGIDIDEQFIKHQIMNQIYQQAFADMIKQDVMSDTDMLNQAYANDIVLVSAGHILLSDEKTANEVMKKIKDGEDFAHLAIEYSQDPGSAMNGGSLGFFPKGKMPPAFEEQVFSMKAGEISEPIKTQRGYHIITLEDTQTVADLEEYGVSKEEVDYHKNSIIREKSLIELNKRLKELVSNAQIEKFEIVMDDKPQVQ